MGRPRITRLVVRNVLAARDVTIEPRRGKVLLFGPNSAGKSGVLLGLLAAIRMLNDDARYLDDAISPIQSLASGGGAVVELELGGKGYRVEVGDGVRLYSGSTYLGPGPQRIASIRAGYVGPCIAVSPRWGADLCGGEISVGDPEVAEHVRRYGWAVDIGLDGFREVYVDRAKLARDGGVWVPVANLAYGVRRALGVVAASFGVDVLVVEAFEAGVHYDAMITLMNYLDEADADVFVETHMALSVAYALKLGWDVYYVEGGVARPVRSVDDYREFARREAEAYSIATGP